MTKYHAKYDEKGEKVYEVVNDEVTINRMDSVSKAGFYVVPDIQPYKSIATGEVINSRAQHRQMLKKHGLVEMGNEKLPEKRIQDVPGRREAIIEACRKHKVKGFY